MVNREVVAPVVSFLDGFVRGRCLSADAIADIARLYYVTGFMTDRNTVAYDTMFY